MLQEQAERVAIVDTSCVVVILRLAPSWMSWVQSPLEVLNVDPDGGRGFNPRRRTNKPSVLEGLSSILSGGV